MISASTAAVCSDDRSRRDASASIASVRIAKEVLQQPLAVGVSTDSGWNWTPSAGRSRWRTAITTPPPRAVTVSASGSSGSATSEW